MVFLPNGVVSDGVTRSRLVVPMQVMNSFFVPALIVMLAFFSIFVLAFFNCFSRLWFNCFTRVNYFTRIHTLICLIFVVRFFLVRFFLLWDYTITIDSNVCYVFDICSVLLRNRCTFLLTTINISLHFSVCRTYFLCLKIE